jgi:hypothetical protein
MKLYLTIAAFACDIVGTVLVIVDAVLARRNKARLGAVQEHITKLEILAHDTDNMPPARPGETVGGVRMDEILDIMKGGVDDATVQSKKVLLEISGEIEKLERFPLTLVASGILFAGIALHFASEFVE